MRSLKFSGDITHGRGVAEVQRNVWLLSNPICAIYSKAEQDKRNVKYANSEQHKELSIPRITRDKQYGLKMLQYFQERNPFVANNDLFSLETGEVASKEVKRLETKC